MEILKEINKIKKELKDIKINNYKDIEFFRIKYLGKNGKITKLFKDLRNIQSSYEKKNIGKYLNIIKNDIINIIISQKKLYNKYEFFTKNTYEDLTKQTSYLDLGSRHPISIIKNRIINIFNNLGFLLTEGPEIEEDWYNFTALNFPSQHPAREMQDTFFIDKYFNKLLRTHTSSVQIRYMEKNKPPTRIISFGKVYRRETISSRSHCMFHQIEGFYIDKNVSFADLKQIIKFFTKKIFNTSRIRLRPSYFPFTTPSAEVDVFLGLKSKKDYQITNGTGWIEIMGCGMIDHNVLKNININTKYFSGFAFGIGIERIALIIYGIDDIRIFFENDLRFLKQFQSENY